MKWSETPWYFRQTTEEMQAEYGAAARRIGEQWAEKFNKAFLDILEGKTNED